MAETIIDKKEREELRELIAGLYDFTDLGGRGRRLFIENAGLGRFIRGISLKK